MAKTAKETGLNKYTEMPVDECLDVLTELKNDIHEGCKKLREADGTAKELEFCDYVLDWMKTTVGEIAKSGERTVYKTAFGDAGDRRTIMSGKEDGNTIILWVHHEISRHCGAVLQTDEEANVVNRGRRDDYIVDFNARFSNRYPDEVSDMKKAIGELLESVNYLRNCGAHIHCWRERNHGEDALGFYIFKEDE